MCVTERVFIASRGKLTADLIHKALPPPPPDGRRQPVTARAISQDPDGGTRPPGASKSSCTATALGDDVDDPIGQMPSPWRVSGDTAAHRHDGLVNGQPVPERLGGGRVVGL